MLRKAIGLPGAIYLLSFLLCHVSAGDAVRPKGVRPELASFYDPTRDFQCLDGSMTVPFTHVNDDYCDCADGSDEPGTSACPNANFYCPNRGYKPTTVFSSRVNDGICDCCDGSDEWASGNACTNTCEEMGAAERAEAERLAKMAEEGLKIKADLSQKGKYLKQQRQNDLEAKKSQKESALQEKETKKSLKEEAEAPEQEALDKIRAEEERLAQLKRDEQKKENERLALEYFAKLDTDQNGELNKDEMSREIRFDQNNDGLISDDEANFYLSGHESYTKESFLDIGWPLMSHLFTPKPESNKSEDGEAGKSGDEGELEDYDYDQDKEGDSQDEDTVTVPTTEAPPASNHEQKYDDATQALIDRANAARAEFETADRAYRDLEREVEDLEKLLEQDFGPDEEFAAMSRECFEYTDAEYTYKLCAFESASQRPKNGGSETRLGNWDRWAGPEDDPYSRMSYTRGAQCWNGPTRSAKVVLKCGSENKVTGVSEPSRCEYEFVFETPAACKKVEVPSHEHDEL